MSDAASTVSFVSAVSDAASVVSFVSRSLLDNFAILRCACVKLISYVSFVLGINLKLDVKKPKNGSPNNFHNFISGQRSIFHFIGVQTSLAVLGVNCTIVV